MTVMAEGCGCACGCGKAGSKAASGRKPGFGEWPLVMAGLAAGAAEAASLALGDHAWIVPLLALVSIAASGVPVYRAGWKALLERNLNINALMTIAVTGAVLIGAWAEAAMVMFLFVLAEKIEERAADRARESVEKLFDAVEETVSVLQEGGSLARVSPETVKVGDVVRVLPGERLALDGRITGGASALNQAPVTGESLPIEKKVGDAVYAGSVNESGIFEYEVTAAAADSTLARIAHAVQEARVNKAPTERFIDRFARVYTPVVVTIAAVIAVVPPLFFSGSWSGWAYRALVVLLIACPCALVIATPVTVVSGLAAAARRGILVKGGTYLENGRRLDLVAFDKTGTLTRGKPEVSRWVSLGGQGRLRNLEIAAGLAACSNHPLSMAVKRVAEKEGVVAAGLGDPVFVAGMGMRGILEGKRYYLGSERFAEKAGIKRMGTDGSGQDSSAVFLFDDEKVLAEFDVIDSLKETSRDAVSDLRALGVETLILSGDNEKAVERVAREVGIGKFKWGLMPEGKLEVLESLAEKSLAVGMVGDGINDTPALASASIGFAMGLLGTEAALETADVAVMDGDLRKVPEFIRLSRSTVRILSQNIALALGLKLVFLGLAVAGFATLWMAVVADVGVSLLVISNGLRLLRSPGPSYAL